MDSPSPVDPRLRSRASAHGSSPQLLHPQLSDPRLMSQQTSGSAHPTLAPPPNFPPFRAQMPHQTFPLMDQSQRLIGMQQFGAPQPNLQPAWGIPPPPMSHDQRPHPHMVLHNNHHQPPRPPYPSLQSPPPNPFSQVPLPHMTFFSPVPPHPSSMLGCVVSPHLPLMPGGVVLRQQPDSDPFVRGWLERIGKQRQNSDMEVSHQSLKSMKIPELRSQLIKVAELISELTSAHQALRDLVASGGDGATWEAVRVKVQTTKAEFLRVRASLDTPGLKEHFSTKLAKRRAQRKRKRRGCRDRKEAWVARVEEAELAADDWIKTEQEKELKAKMEKSVQLSASGVLEEVKKKKTEVERLVGVAEALKELRAIRREASRKEGNAPPIEEDEKFESTHTTLLELLSQQVGVYEREEHALRVLMEEEVLEKMQSHQQQTKAAKQESVVAVDLTSDPMESCRQFYLQARSNKGALEAIRCGWDAYVSPSGSFPPSSYDLQAPPPSSPAWLHFCIKEQE